MIVADDLTAAVEAHAFRYGLPAEAYRWPAFRHVWESMMLSGALALGLAFRRRDAIWQIRRDRQDATEAMAAGRACLLSERHWRTGGKQYFGLSAPYPVQNIFGDIHEQLPYTGRGFREL
jgi:hypothetical protein